MLTCREVPEIATDAMEGNLDLRTRLKLRLHLAICSMCRAYMDQLRRTKLLLARQTLPAPEAPVVERLVAAATHGPE